MLFIVSWRGETVVKVDEVLILDDTAGSQNVIESQMPAHANSGNADIGISMKVTRQKWANLSSQEDDFCVAAG